jgi:predicted acetyltransferase
MNATQLDSPLEVAPIAPSEEPVLRHLIDLYAYDFSEILGLDVEDDGRFRFPALAPYWTDPGHHPFFFRVAGKLAGFALVQDRSHLTGAQGVHDMAEFFVLRRYRRQGLGALAARELFRRFPGPWEVRERPANVGAIAFWRRVIDGYTEGAFREAIWADGAWRGPVQLFTSGAREPE